VEVYPIDYKIKRVIHYHEYMLSINKIEEIEQPLVEVLQRRTQR